MRRILRRGSAVLVTLITAAVGVVVTGSTAQADPIENSVWRTAFIWNCPTGAPGCFPGAQKRVGDVRVNESLLDVCTGEFGGNVKNLVFNRTSRVGAAERTGFLYRSNLSVSDVENGQNDSCYSGGVRNFAEGGTQQRLCPYFACSGTGEVPDAEDPMLRDFCYTLTDGTEWRLIVTYDTDTSGPVTAGFVPLSELNPFVLQQDYCYE